MKKKTRATNKAQRENLHEIKYKKLIQPMYEPIHNCFNSYIETFESDEDKLAADFHCIHNLFVFGFARLQLMAQQTGDAKYTYNDALQRIMAKGIDMGLNAPNLNGRF